MSTRQLIDRYGRRIDYLRISVTDRCNLRCVYCVPEEGILLSRQEEILSYEEILRVSEIAISLGIKKIRITGGEPLVRKDIIYLIRSIAGLKGIKDFSITTNGILLSEFLPDLVNAGIRRINISLDSLDEEVYASITRGGELRKVLNGIDSALRADPSPVKINTVVVRGLNDMEVLDFAKMTLDMPLWIRFIEFMPIGNGIFWSKDKFISGMEMKERCGELDRLCTVNTEGNGDVKYYRYGNAKGMVGFVNPISEPFCNKCSKLRLTSDGKLKYCLFSSSEIDLKTKLRSGSSNEEIADLMRMAVYEKPARHHIADGTINQPKSMCQIGG